MTAFAASLTTRLRLAAVIAWSTGLAVMAFDFLSLPVGEWRASLCYAFFGLAACLTAWAEKREFGSRVALYRLHDAAIYSPWRFLLLYFLWISVFAPFTQSPPASLLYATNGWLSLFSIGLTAQFIFCERTATGMVLLPARLRVAFWSYCLTVSLLLANVLAHLLFPHLSLPMLVNQQANLFLYFTLGLPFLLWDLLKEGRHLVPRWLSAITVIMGAVATLLLNSRFYLLAIAMSVSAIFALFLFKRIRMRRAILLGALLAGWGLAVGLALLLFLERFGLRHALEFERFAMAERMRGNFAQAISALADTSGLGQGVGLSDLRGVWTRVTAEAGLVGAVLYALFFVQLTRDLYRVRRSARPVVSNVALVSVGVFLVLVGHHVENPYGAYVWAWYALWAVFASTPKSRAEIARRPS